MFNRLKSVSKSQRVRNMFKLLIIAAVVAVGLADPLPLSSSRLNPFTPNGRIVGGEPATIEEVPWQVSLQYLGFGFCGGSIIGETWIVTAAHCAIYPAGDISVRAGTRTMSTGGSLHKVKSIIKHEQYTTNAYGIPINDVALFNLADPLRLDATRKPIAMFEMNEQITAGTATMITGWGATREGGSVMEDLQKVSVPSITKAACSTAYAAFGGVPAGQICAAYPQGGKDACQGDSGGPMTVNGRLAGITSWGNGCARPGYPGVYTEIATFRTWIQQKTGASF